MLTFRFSKPERKLLKEVFEGATSLTEGMIEKAVGESEGFLHLWNKLLKAKEKELASSGKKVAGGALALAKMKIRKSLGLKK